jgi:tyrosine-protein kinase Etk/Wzc
LNQEVYIQFQKQYELAKIQELDDQTLIQVVKNPEVPVRRSKPKRSLIVMVSLIGGAFVGIFGAFIWYYLYVAFKKKLFRRFNEPLAAN